MLYQNTTEKNIDGIRVIYFKAWNIKKWPGTLGPIWLPDLRHYIKRELANFDVVHINGYRNVMHLPITLTGIQSGIPVLIQPHGTLPVIINSFFIKRLYDRIVGKTVLKAIGALIALQQSEVTQALYHGVPRDRIHIIPNGIDPAAKKDLPKKGLFRRKHQITQQSKIILFAARINRKKGTDMLVKAFAHMNHDLDAKLIIAGPDDGQLAEVKKLVSMHGLKKHVVFTGLLSHSEVLEAFVDADLYVLPCRKDTFPMAMVEACLTDTPMVVTDRCEIADLVRDKVAVVVPFDANEFGQAMESLIRDQTRIQCFQDECAKRLEEVFSLQSVVDKLEKLYQKLISEFAHDQKSVCCIR
jgi:glycosyltransferase involved in cell wall biosynthesis